MAASIVRVLLALALASFGAVAAGEDDPPARVGRASLVEGDVAYLRDGEWVPLPLNWPITTGARLSAAPGARAEVRVGSAAVRLAGATEVEIVRLDDHAIALRLLNGTIDARVRSAEVARELTIETPEARASLLEPGRYRFDAGPEPDVTSVSTDAGAARVDAGGSAVVVRPGQRAEARRNGELRLDDARPDAFDEWALARDRHNDASPTARYVSPEMTGYESLAEHGDWREVPEYGPVWVPRAVPAGWAPYRTGRWAWVAPWGWTWIDEAPWGFAPFHYGRWAFVGGIWMWAPGRIVPRPVFAPALVGWVGRPGWSVSVSIGTVPAVGWFPLAPREVFVPAYRHSHAYVRNVNIAHVTNVTQITNVTQVTNVNYVNRRIERAVTVVPAAAVTHGQPVARAQVHVRRAELDRNPPASPTPPAAAVAPSRPAPEQMRRHEGPQRRFDAEPRARELPRAERADGRRPEMRTQPASTLSVQAPPTTPSRTLEVRPEPRRERRQEIPRGDAPRGNVPVAPAPPPVQAQPRTEPRQDPQRMEAPRAVAPAAPPVQASPRPEPRVEPRREVLRMEGSRTSAPPPQHAQPRFEPRREPQRVDATRALAPVAPTPPAFRVEPRPAPPAPVARVVTPAPQAAPPAPQPQQRPPAPRNDGHRGHGGEQRRGDGRGPG
ncbi:MAG: hypothetical protein IT519_02225 [Burkholderiales bacterium]|nr:hypothetical protein [Burkholderiales bacterium]